MHYFDTGVLLKLYTVESESAAVQDFVSRRGASIPFHSFHDSECSSAFHLKAFRGECSIPQANRALEDLHEDIRNGVLCRVRPEWDDVWDRCRELSLAHAAVTGCRTLDTLHIACAIELGFRNFVTSDKRQHALAERMGLQVIDPTQDSQ